MPQSAENVIAAIEQRRIAAMMATDINTLDELIDEQCTHIESNGTSPVFYQFRQLFYTASPLLEHSWDFSDSFSGRSL